MDPFDIAFHFSYGVAHQHTLEIIAVMEAMGDPGRYGINIFQHRGIFRAYDIIADLGVDEVTFKAWAINCAFASSAQAKVK